MSHTVTVTKLPDMDDENLEYEVGGEHDSQCEFYRPCHKDWHRHPKNESELMETWSTKRVPEVHAWLDGEWMTLAHGECAVAFCYELDNSLRDWVYAPGTYPLKIEWDGDCWEAYAVVPEPDDSGSETHVKGSEHG
jgi:hypothetical protein